MEIKNIQFPVLVTGSAPVLLGLLQFTETAQNPVRGSQNLLVTCPMHSVLTVTPNWPAPACHGIGVQWDQSAMGSVCSEISVQWDHCAVG